MGRRRRQGSNGHSGHHHARGGLFQGEPFGINPGDDVGNRKAKDARQLPPDDIGNRKDDEPGFIMPPDDVGNRVDAMPTHDLSGVLSELHGKRAGQNTRPRRARGSVPQVRLGRYVLGGVNPLVSLDQFRAQKAQEDENERRQQGGQRERFERTPDAVNGGDGASTSRNERFEQNRNENRGDARFDRNRPRRGEYDAQSAEPVVGERRIQRFFDFDEDDRFEYTLKSTPDEKREAARASVTEIVNGASRDATVDAVVIDDGDKPKVVVTIEERGPAASLASDRRAKSAADPLFVLGNPALMSLNYLVNKIVNRYPADRIRLAIIPHGDLQAYKDALAQHRQAQSSAPAQVAHERAPALEAVVLETSVVDEEEAIVTLPMIGVEPAADEAFADVETVVSHELNDDAPSIDDEGLEPPRARSRVQKAPAKAARAKKTTAEPQAVAKPKAPAKAAKTTADAEAPAKKKRATRAPVETAILPAVQKVSRLKKSPPKK